MDLDSVERAERLLARYGYDRDLQARFAERAARVVDNAVRGRLEVMPEDHLATLPALGTTERRRLRERGLDMIRRGQVGAVVLAGGMATRFGGVVKAVVDAYDDGGTARSFLECKHADVRRIAEAADVEVPMFVMSSFATHDELGRHVDERALSSPTVELFPQMVALRLTPDGHVFRDDAGHLSPYATGHGDLTFAMRASGALQRFRTAGGTTLLMSNVDNLAATLDPAMIGLHAELGGAITCEVVRKVAGDKGGAPALLDGVPQIIEGFRFPEAFDQDAIAVFNTNTFVLDAAAIDRDFDLPYYRVVKSVDGRTVIQFERLVGELTGTLPTRFVEVPRAGPDCRFLPVKDPDELERQRPLIARVVSSRRSLDDVE